MSDFCCFCQIHEFSLTCIVHINGVQKIVQLSGMFMPIPELSNWFKSWPQSFLFRGARYDTKCACFCFQLWWTCSYLSKNPCDLSFIWRLVPWELASPDRQKKARKRQHQMVNWEHRVFVLKMYRTHWDPQRNRARRVALTPTCLDTMSDTA